MIYTMSSTIHHWRHLLLHVSATGQCRVGTTLRQSCLNRFSFELTMHEQCRWNTSSPQPRLPTKDPTIRWTRSSTRTPGETMMAPKVDVPNYNESIDQIDYKSLVLLGQKSTATTYVDRAALAMKKRPQFASWSLRRRTRQQDSCCWAWTAKQWPSSASQWRNMWPWSQSKKEHWPTSPVMSELANGGSRQRVPHNPGRSKSAELARVERTRNAIVKHSDGGNSLGPQQLVLPSDNEARQFIPA